VLSDEAFASIGEWRGANMSDSGSGKRGFVRDVMKRISAQGSREPEERDERARDEI